MGAQIDLVFDRNDGIVNICEIKYSKSAYALDKVESGVLLNKAKVYRDVTKTKKHIFISLITTFGLKDTLNSAGIVVSTSTLDDLFNKTH